MRHGSPQRLNPASTIRKERNDDVRVFPCLPYPALVVLRARPKTDAGRQAPLGLLSPRLLLGTYRTEVWGGGLEGEKGNTFLWCKIY